MIHIFPENRHVWNVYYLLTILLYNNQERVKKFRKNKVILAKSIIVVSIFRGQKLKNRKVVLLTKS